MVTLRNGQERRMKGWWETRLAGKMEEEVHGEVHWEVIEESLRLRMRGGDRWRRRPSRLLKEVNV